MSAARGDSTSWFCLITDSPLHPPSLVKNAIAGSEKFTHCSLPSCTGGEKSHTDKNLKDVLYVLQLHTKPHTQPANVAVLSVSRENNSDSFQWQTVGIKCGCGIFSKSQSHNKFRVKA